MPGDHNIIDIQNEHDTKGFSKLLPGTGLELKSYAVVNSRLSYINLFVTSCLCLRVNYLSAWMVMSLLSIVVTSIPRTIVLIFTVTGTSLAYTSPDTSAKWWIRRSFILKIFLLHLSHFGTIHVEPKAV